MNKLSKLTLATLLGASTLSGCGKPYWELSPEDGFLLVGTPVSRVERSQESGSTLGSYTLFIDVSSPEHLRGQRCAYRSSVDIDTSNSKYPSSLRNQRVEREILLFDMHREQKTPVEFAVRGFTTDRCVVISSPPEEYRPR